MGPFPGSGSVRKVPLFSSQLVSQLVILEKRYHVQNTGSGSGSPKMVILDHF